MRARVLFVTTGLHTGGAEKQLFLLLSHLHKEEIEAGVVSLLSPGSMSSRISALGIPVWHLGMESPLRLPQAVWRLARITHRFRPGVIQGWMYHGNLAAMLAKTLSSRRARMIWGIRQSLYDLKREKVVTRGVIRMGAHLSKHADTLVFNSQTARVQHESFGFGSNNSLVIDNGFDTELFRPDEDARSRVRKELGLRPDAKLIGKIARYHPMKGHQVFLKAAMDLAERIPDVHFVLVGRGVDADNQVFAPWLRRPMLADRLHLLGERTDIPRLTAALDIASSSSWGEAFPNTIGEAMSCAVPCVATDVGDVKRIVGKAGVVVPAGDEKALAVAWESLLLNDEERHSMGKAARSRVMDKFSLDRAARRYGELYTNSEQVTFGEQK
ncbi:MAG: glycosyltransferase [Gammaproteobacteria bacterium]|nr:MAG: glycosyltransferase [Gammaproteobacteria bacterium]